MILAEGEIVRQAALPDRGVLASLSLLRVLRGFCISWRTSTTETRQPNRTKSMKTNLSFSPTLKVGVERDCIPAPNHFNGLQVNLPAHVFAGAI